jgi:hypothetical protein
MDSTNDNFNEMEFSRDAMIYMYMRDFKKSFEEASLEVNKYFEKTRKEMFKDLALDSQLTRGGQDEVSEFVGTFWGLSPIKVRLPLP